MAYETQIILIALGSWLMVLALVGAAGLLAHDRIKEFKAWKAENDQKPV